MLINKLEMAGSMIFGTLELYYIQKIYYKLYKILDSVKNDFRILEFFFNVWKLMLLL